MGYTLKGRDVDKLEAIAKKLGKSYTDCFAEIVGRAHEQMFGAAEQDEAQKPGAKGPAKGDSSVKGEGQKALEEVGEAYDGHVTEDSSNEHQDAPQRGDRPNPLAIKRWANVKDDDDEDEERQRSVAKQRQTLASGRAQR